jgi:hypothetical protein
MCCLPLPVKKIAKELDENVVKLALSESIMNGMSPMLCNDAYSSNVDESVNGKSNLLRL